MTKTVSLNGKYIDVCIVNERLVMPLAPEAGLTLSATRSFGLQASIESAIRKLLIGGN